MSLKNRSFLKLLDYTPAEIEELLDLAADLKARKKAGIRHNEQLAGKNIALIFEKTPPGCWAGCLTASSTAAMGRRSWKTWPITPVFRSGMA